MFLGPKRFKVLTEFYNGRKVLLKSAMTQKVCQEKEKLGQENINHI